MEVPKKQYGLPVLVMFMLFLLFSKGTAHAQASACPQVNAGPDVTICGGCTNLTATVQGTAGTNTYTVNSIPYNPYPFTGGNPVLVNIDDTWSGVINMPICFDFFGNTYNQLLIGSNALITFDISQAGGYCQWPISAGIPSNTNPMNSIMAPFHDIDPSVGTPTSATDINWAVYGTAPCREFVINWNDVAMFSCNSIIATSQLVLHESTNIIDIYILNKPLCSSWNSGAAIEGIQDATGTNAFVVPGRNYPTQWTAANDGYRFMPNGPPNYTVQWVDQNNNVVGSGTTVTVCPTQTTTYTAVVTNTSCSGPIVVNDQVTVNVTSGSLNVTPASTNATCANPCSGTASVTATGGTPPYTYSWAPVTGSGTSVSGLCVGTYTCTITEASGCSTTATFNITQPPSVSTTMSSTTATCGNSNGSASVALTGGTGPFTYSWSPQGGTGATANNIPPGQYTVTVTDANGCQVVDTITVANAGMNVATAQTTPTCFGSCNGSATVTPSLGTPPYTYNWTPSGGTGATATGLCAGTYTCNVADATGCVSTQTFSITQPAAVTVAMSNNTTICAGMTATITATPAGGTGPYTVTWSNGLPNGTSNTVTPATNTTYTATVTDANGCTANDTVNVSLVAAPTASFTASVGDCAPSTINFTNNSTGGVSYLWNFGDPSSGANDTSSAATPTHVYLLGGSYNVTLTVFNAAGCSTTVVVNNAVTVIGFPNAAVSVGNDHLSEFDPTAVFTDLTTGGTNCVLYFGDGDSIVGCGLGTYTHMYPAVGTYTVMYVTTNASGCSDTTYLTVMVEQETTIYVPNAFSPNGDGNNEMFYAYGSNVNEFDMMIFDRWGTLMFESKDLFKGWDGKYKGSPVQEDVYVWKIVYTDTYNKRHRLIGHVTAFH